MLFILEESLLNVEGSLLREGDAFDEEVLVKILLLAFPVVVFFELARPSQSQLQLRAQVVHLEYEDALAARPNHSRIRHFKSAVHLADGGVVLVRRVRVPPVARGWVLSNHKPDKVALGQRHIARQLSKVESVALEVLSELGFSSHLELGELALRLLP